MNRKDPEEKAMMNFAKYNVVSELFAVIMPTRLLVHSPLYIEEVK